MQMQKLCQDGMPTIEEIDDIYASLRINKAELLGLRLYTGKISLHVFRIQDPELILTVGQMSRSYVRVL